MFTININNQERRGVKSAKEMKWDGGEERGRGQTLSAISRRSHLVRRVTCRKESGTKTQSQDHLQKSDSQSESRLAVK